MKCPKCGSSETRCSTFDSRFNYCIKCDCTWTSWQQSIIAEQAKEIERLQFLVFFANKKADDFDEIDRSVYEREIERLKAHNAFLKAEDDHYRPVLEAEVEYSKQKISRLQSLLDEIENHPHCKWNKEPKEYETGATLFDAGHVEGHRCAAAIARKAKEGE